MSNGIMSEKYMSIFLLGTVLCIVLQTSAAAITETECTPGDANEGNTKCQSVDQNAECPGSTTKCACKTGYKVNPADDTKCLLSITQVPCTPGDGTGGDAKCVDLDENSECRTGGTHCTCKTGYIGTDTCAKLPITQVPCTPGDGNDAICMGLDENSECPTGATHCTCKTGYIGTDTCTMPITQVTCTPDDVNNGDAKCEGLDENSECTTGATHCTCKSGYAGTDTCTMQSSADSVKVTTTVIAMSLLSFIVRRIM